MKHWSVLLLLLATVRVQAAEPTPAPPKIDVPAQVEPYDPIVATVQGDASLVLWDRSSTYKYQVLPGGRIIHIWAPPGKHVVSCRMLSLVIDWDTKTSQLTVAGEPIAEFTVGEAPEPEPKPEPKPTPTPTKVAALYFIYETKDATPAIADVKDDKAWKDMLTAAKIDWKVMDDEAAERQVPNATELARKKGLPAVVLLAPDKTATVLAAPQTKEAMRELAKQCKGGAQ